MAKTSRRRSAVEPVPLFKTEPGRPEDDYEETDNPPECDRPAWLADFFSDAQGRTTAGFQWRMLVNAVAVSANAKLVGHVLESHCRPWNRGRAPGGRTWRPYVWPTSYPRLHDETWLSERAIQRAVVELEDAGLLHVVRDPKPTAGQRGYKRDWNRYCLAWPAHCPLMLADLTAEQRRKRRPRKAADDDG